MMSHSPHSPHQKFTVEFPWRLGVYDPDIETQIDQTSFNPNSSKGRIQRPSLVPVVLSARINECGTGDSDDFVYRFVVVELRS